MLNAVRTLDTYCPVTDLRDRYPGWTVRLTDNPPRKEREVFLPDEGAVLVDRAMYERDPERVVAHVLAHLDLHQIDGAFTPVQEQEAETLAAVWLDRPGSR